jgi:hypothetical protein
MFPATGSHRPEIQAVEYRTVQQRHSCRCCVRRRVRAVRFDGSRFEMSNNFFMTFMMMMIMMMMF